MTEFIKMFPTKDYCTSPWMWMVGALALKIEEHL